MAIIRCRKCGYEEKIRTITPGLPESGYPIGYHMGVCPKCITGHLFVIRRFKW